MVKVSVIIPIYNVEAFLGECLLSVQAQTLREIEILLVDDGSSDNSGKIADSFAAADPRMRVFRQKNSGYASACNVGLSMACGKYISIVEPDDFIEPDMLERLYNCAEENRADVAKARYWEMLDLPSKRIERVCGAVIESAKPFILGDHPELLSMHPSIWSCLYLRDFIREFGISFISGRYRGWEDNPFQIQTLYLARRISYVNDPLYHWRVLSPMDYVKIPCVEMPIERIDAMHSFLASEGCSNPQIYEALFRRDMVYFKKIFQKAPLADLPYLRGRVKAYFRRLAAEDALYTPVRNRRLVMFPCIYFMLTKLTLPLKKTLKNVKIRLK